jgi:hypothetical protein
MRSHWLILSRVWLGAYVYRWLGVVYQLILSIKTFSLWNWWSSILGRWGLHMSNSLMSLCGKMVSKSIPCVSPVTIILARVVIHHLPDVLFGPSMLLGWWYHRSVFQANFHRFFWIHRFKIMIWSNWTILNYICKSLLLEDCGHRTRFESSVNFLCRWKLAWNTDRWYHHPSNMEGPKRTSGRWWITTLARIMVTGLTQGMLLLTILPHKLIRLLLIWRPHLPRILDHQFHKLNVLMDKINW